MSSIGVIKRLIKYMFSLFSGKSIQARVARAISDKIKDIDIDAEISKENYANDLVSDIVK